SRSASRPMGRVSSRSRRRARRRRRTCWASRPRGPRRRTSASQGPARATRAGTATDVLGIAAAWAAPADERFYGLGERADAAQHRGARVENYVSDGPWIEENRALISAILPPPGFRARDDSTYFPIPWILSSRGYGVLVDNDETSYHDLATVRP